MSKVSVTKSKLDDLADIISAKSGIPTLLTVDEMREAVDEIHIPVGTVTITENGTHNVRSYDSAVIDVVGGNLQTKTVTPSESQVNVYPDSGYDGMSSVTVEAISDTYIGSAVPTENGYTITPSNSSQTAVEAGTYVVGDITVGAIPSNYIIPSGTMTITESGLYDVSGYASAEVDIDAGGCIAVTVTEETLPGGGTAKHIVGVDISNDTVDAEHLATGYTAHDAQGNALVGTMSGGSSVTVEPLSVVANGTYTAPSGTAYSPVTVNVPSEGGGGSTASPGDVTFYDYDGTVVTAYSASEFANLTAMPENPSHSGLTAQGWNWSLSDAKTYVATYGKLDIGQMYITDDGKTRLYVTVDDIAQPEVKVAFACSVSTGVTIDWGDGSTAQTSTSTSRTEYSHTYSAVGDYVITLDVTSGTMTWSGTSGNAGCGMMGTRGGDNTRIISRLWKVEIGSGIGQIGQYWFLNCYGLKYISLPNSITLATHVFDGCYKLAHITIPLGCTSIPSYSFYYCYALRSVSFPNTISSISSYAFSSCQSLKFVSLPSGMNSISGNVFQNCSILSNIIIPKNVISIGSSSFSSCNLLEQISLSTDSTSISSSAFQYCRGLISIIIPSHITSITSNVFNSCTSLRSVTFLGEITNIETNAFSTCPMLASIVIPDTVTSIGGSAFYNNTSLKVVHLRPTTPPTLGDASVFNGNAPGRIIYVPYSADHSILEAYQTATNWSTYASYMQEEPT